MGVNKQRQIMQDWLTTCGIEGDTNEAAAELIQLHEAFNKITSNDKAASAQMVLSTVLLRMLKS